MMMKMMIMMMLCWCCCCLVTHLIIMILSFLVIDKPKLTISSANITLNETAPLSVNCSVTASPAAGFVWTALSGKVVSNSAVLAFNSIDRRDESIYQCTVSNAAGSKKSNSLSVVVQCKWILPRFILEGYFPSKSY